MLYHFTYRVIFFKKKLTGVEGVTEGAGLLSCVHQALLSYMMYEYLKKGDGGTDSWMDVHHFEIL